MIPLCFRPTFVLQDEKLIKKRIGSSCGLIQGKDGQEVVAIVGGSQKGMEIWNPIRKTVELLWDEIPAEKDFGSGLFKSELVPIEGEKEFILYGGGEWISSSTKDDIWKYVVADNTWTRYFFFVYLFQSI